MRLEANRDMPYSAEIRVLRGKNVLVIRIPKSDVEDVLVWTESEKGGVNWEDPKKAINCKTGRESRE